ncbi:MAG: transcription-repair coupling factor, partial [Planctomycetaceae bacterium]|nr:transcription-repair coupling factor [Planctomycetaceae bacterium]
MVTAARQASDSLHSLVSLIAQAPGFEEVVAALRRSQTATISGAWGSASALTVAALAAEAPGPLVMILPRMSDVDDFARDLEAFTGISVPQFPAWETLNREHSAADPIFGQRLRILTSLESTAPPALLVTSLPALLQPVPSRATRESSSRTLRVGDEADPEVLFSWLVERGFDRVPAIEAPGEFAVRGSILDVYPPGAIDPVRIEFFGDEIESIRGFDVESQRQTDSLTEVLLTLVTPVDLNQLEEPDAPPLPGSPNTVSSNGDSSTAEPSGTAAAGTVAHALDSLPANAWIVLAELQDLVGEARSWLARTGDRSGLFTVDSTLERTTRHPTATVAAIVSASETAAACQLHVESVERFARPRKEALDELNEVIGPTGSALIACHNEGERERLGELIQEAELESASRIRLCVGTLSRGFRYVSAELVVLSDHELFGRTAVQQHAPARKKSADSRAIDSFLQLKENDLVVHLTHGIGRYRGMTVREAEDRTEEHLVLEFHDAVRVLVPVSLIHLVQKYVGATKAAPRLSRISSGTWAKKKQKVAQAVQDMASDMLRLQAARDSRPGIEFPPDSHWQQEFDAAFPYVETEDQVAAILDAKRDMEQPRPMDRLICGDVGYGKTEVAMRAVFKAVDAGRQVAVLVPTTVLAEQHYRTFCERLAEYPFTIEVLSRFRTKKETKDVLERMDTGAVDIVIGTHRIVQKDVRFRDLGLIIIDEEQRFGVEAKEMLKQLRLEVDVLTLSATPIPRTLHMSLLGVRDISNLTTAPVDRQAIETRVCRTDRELIRRGIMRELNRGGQVYFVHNRVHNIQSIADMIQSIAPEANIGIGHGQMGGDELEQTMYNFVTGRTDILVSTTIIESGVDIPNANTIFINQANIYGLAELHQLRGRVGRYRNRAYCYLLLDDSRRLTPQASRRLKAIEEFSELGAGFRIAMRDLEIRGAGNILGTEQSGHISSVGYELYCQLLENAVRGLKNEPLREYRQVKVDLPVHAWLPDDYIPAGRVKIDLYRKLSSIDEPAGLEEFHSELRDRFGPVPAGVERLLRMRRLQLDAWQWGAESIHLEDGYAVLTCTDPARLRLLGKLSKGKMRVVSSRQGYIVLTDP